MIRIQYLPDNLDTMFIRHKTWITVNGQQYESRLLNQYDLAEVIEGAHDALKPDARLRAYRRWLWQEMRDEYGIIWTELSLLADAHVAGLEIVVTVHKASVHAPIIAQAVEWMVRNTERVEHRPQRRPRVRPVPFDYALVDREVELERWRLVWITGRTASHIGYLLDIDGVVTAFVPGWRLIRLGRFDVFGSFDQWPKHVRRLKRGYQVTEEFAATAVTAFEAAQELEPDRYHPWREDALEVDPTAQTLNDFDDYGMDDEAPSPDWLAIQPKRPWFLRAPVGPLVRDVLRWNASKPHRPRVLDSLAQRQGRFSHWRPASRADWDRLYFRM